MTLGKPAQAPHFERVAVIGVGLIGGSFALGLKAAGACGTVVGVGRDPANMRVALQRGIVDRVETDASAAVRDADLVLVSTPVGQFGALFARIAPALSPAAIVMDAGSTKQDVVAAARAALGARVAQFVPSHPIAGAEHSGAAAAKADLFVNKRVVLTPLAENPQTLADAAAAAWEACGARIFRMSGAEHDAVFAAVSHLPHLLAFGLVHEFAQRVNSGQLFGYAAGGFRDFTRIASSHPEMWRDICTANRDALLVELDCYMDKLRALRTPLAAGDGEALEKIFAQARSARSRWLAGEFEL
ncbi:MAG: prephenate dehydrogenase/arogenate dehydrogenase family protein [Betaproteobacteria bacterium]|nr:prephenate dehydrogenase/arogenate dehydrogenase family protein [Betaproteobacteria bacterium]